MTTTLAPAQYDAAYRLAAAHGHGWATRANADRLGGPEDIALDAIVADADPDGLVPALDERGHVVHTTATGRLRWDVAPDGVVRVEVHRPHPVARALRAPEGNDEAAVMAILAPVADRLDAYAAELDRRVEGVIAEIGGDDAYDRALRDVDLPRAAIVEHDAWWGYYQGAPAPVDATRALRRVSMALGDETVATAIVGRDGRVVERTIGASAEERHVEVLDYALAALACGEEDAA